MEKQTDQAAKPEDTRRKIALEMEKAYNATTNAGKLKQSKWWQDRKQLLALYN